MEAHSLLGESTHGTRLVLRIDALGPHPLADSLVDLLDEGAVRTRIRA
ncbi:hypothetical protein [Nocardioides jiangxiensis]|uniref:Uncharacterized protein n=1 Tax=Nocardioides jiangxiensis TaxID=3064524 RepID=A0ABT9B2N6_9ACTN|nr:hypothetical protein [Nocardioides sp. WY-20]MDO7868958.1 hypothetical protein [Nocardioides sp. WY-20]